MLLLLLLLLPSTPSPAAPRLQGWRLRLPRAHGGLVSCRQHPRARGARAPDRPPAPASKSSSGTPHTSGVTPWCLPGCWYRFPDEPQRQQRLAHTRTGVCQPRADGSAAALFRQGSARQPPPCVPIKALKIVTYKCNSRCFWSRIWYWIVRQAPQCRKLRRAAIAAALQEA